MWQLYNMWRQNRCISIHNVDQRVAQSVNQSVRLSVCPSVRLLRWDEVNHVDIPITVTTLTVHYFIVSTACIPRVFNSDSFTPMWHVSEGVLDVGYRNSISCVALSLLLTILCVRQCDMFSLRLSVVYVCGFMQFCTSTSPHICVDDAHSLHTGLTVRNH